MASVSKFNKTVFDNGLTLVSERLSQFRGLSMGVWVKVGTRHETPQVAGVSHFLEHMLFKGTKSRTALQIAREVDQVGGEFNAFTAREHTCFHLMLLDRDCNLGLDILSDILMNSSFRGEEFERERKVILQEISMVEDSPEEIAFDLFFERIYGNHGLGKPILGSVASIQKMDRKLLKGFFKQNYRADQLVVSVAGDVSHNALKKKLSPLLRKNWWGASPSKPRGLEPKPIVQSGFWWVERDTEQAHLIWGVAGPMYASEDRFAAFLLNVYLGGGMSSTLFQEIREKNGLAYTVYSSLSPFVDSGVFSVYVATRAAEVPTCLRLIEECVERLKRKPLSKFELKVIQDNLKGTVLLSADDVESRMASIAKNDIFLNKYMSLKEVCKQIDAVTPADVQRLANTLFKEAGRSIFVLGRKPANITKAKFPNLQVSR